MHNSKLKIGLLVDGRELTAWACRMVEFINQSDYADIAVIVRNILADEKRRSARSGDADLRTAVAGNAWDRLLGQIGLAALRLLVDKPGRLPNALQLVDAATLLTGVEVIEVRPRREDSFDWIEEGDLARIRSHDLDVLIQLGFGTLRGGILLIARHGIWSCEIGDDRTSRGGPAGYWEVMESRPEIGSTLRILTEGPDGTQVAYRSFSSTGVMSLPDSKSAVLWKSLHFIPRKLKQLHEEGGADFFARLREANSRPQFYDRRLRKLPAFSELSAILWRKGLQKVVRKWEEIFYLKQWLLLYDIQDRMSTTLGRFRHITPPKDRFWADPFVVARDNKYYVFIEECLFAVRKGHISVIELHKDGNLEAPVRVLEVPYHLSYPFVFEFEGGLYMIPESAANRTVDLYKCTSFPYKWEFQKHLRRDLVAVDTTLFEWQGKWWMFANEIETRGASTWDELFLYSSDNPLSDNWTPHPKNPIVSDVRSARPAGRLFVRNGRIYRPSQNCAGHYGYGFNICEIVTLTETDYQEVVVERVEPKWDKNIISTHTLNYEEGLTIIDGQLRRRK